MVFGVNLLDKQLTTMASSLKSHKNLPNEIKTRFKEIKDKVNKLKKVFTMGGFEGYYRRPLKLALHGGPLPEQVFRMQMAVNNYPGKPTATMKKRLTEITGKMLPLLQMGMIIIQKDIPDFNKLLRKHNIDHLKLPPFKMDM